MSVFLELHRKKQQLESLLARQRADYEEVNKQLAALETELADPQRTQVRELRQLLGRF